MTNSLTYAEASSGINEIISSLGFPLVTGEAEVKPQTLELRKQVSAYFRKLNRENKLDVLHAYNAESKAELIENALTEMFERVAEV
tara:strand:- start:1685 stop:1942 length:258 start_codon:yes stop_codon:yes gene_type:complete